MISIIIPAYNEEKVLPQLLDRLANATSGWDTTYEVIFIDDGSNDLTWSMISDYSKKHVNIKGVRLSRNFGHQAALTAGLTYASGDAAIIMDADLQDPPEILKQFIDKWKQGYEVVYAVRKKRKEPFLKRMSYFLFYRLLKKMSDIDIPLDSGDFCLMDRKVINQLNALPEKRRFIRGLRSWVGFSQTGIEYERPARADGEPKYNIKKLFQLAMSGLLSFSSVPLRFASMLGAIISALSFFGLAFFTIYRVLDLKFFGYSIKEAPGTATIFLTLLFLSGIQLITIGIIGEYLGQVFEEIKSRPPYVARDTVGIKHGFKN